MRVNQAGFRSRCTDQIFTLRRNILKHRLKSATQATCFIDFATAFDSIDKIAL